jgi:hypothetical protein
LSPLRFFSIVNCWTAIITREEMMSFSFANCHIDCVRPDAIRAMYLVDCDPLIKIKLTT